MLTAARYGITEMMTAILGKFPVAVNDVDADKKNIVLIAVETRQREPYNMLLNNYIPYNVPSLNNASQELLDDNKNEKELQIHAKDNAFRVVDIHGNRALHLAAKLGKNYEPWSIPGEALQMQWEIKWHKVIDLDNDNFSIHITMLICQINLPKMCFGFEIYPI